MGVHQFKIALLPRACFSQPVPVVLSEADIDSGEDGTSGWWASHPPSVRFLSDLRALLPTDKSWGNVEEFISTEKWGSDLRIWKDEDRVFAIVFRFSPISDKWSLLQRFLSIARNESCLLLDQKSGTVFEPDEKIVRQQFDKSQAARFVRDPKRDYCSGCKGIRR